VDTSALFPIRDRAEGGSKALEVLVLYGRAPTDAERAEASKNFPNARIEHVPDAAEPRIETALKPHAEPVLPQPKPKALHAEQLAHSKRLAKAAKQQGVDVAQMERVARPCVELTTRAPTAADKAIGSSRIGGTPDLPAGVDWPEGSDGPMAFVAQLDLGAIASYDPQGLLPAKGVMSFFVSSFDEGAILVVEDPKKLRAVKTPPAVTFAKVR